MNKLGLILVGATLFDLGTVVASSHAAVDSFMKIKLDAMHTASSCVTGGGSVVTSGGDKFCQPKAVVAKGAVLSPGANAATKAPAKKEEAKKE